MSTIASQKFGIAIPRLAAPTPNLSRTLPGFVPARMPSGNADQDADR